VEEEMGKKAEGAQGGVEVPEREEEKGPLEVQGEREERSVEEG
jgi:hypothetical protein